MLVRCGVCVWVMCVCVCSQMLRRCSQLLRRIMCNGCRVLWSQLTRMRTHELLQDADGNEMREVCIAGPYEDVSWNLYCLEIKAGTPAQCLHACKHAHIHTRVFACACTHRSLVRGY